MILASATSYSLMTGLSAMVVYVLLAGWGGRWQERKNPDAAPHSRLGLLRWPEKTLVLDTGEVVGTVGFAAQCESSRLS